MIEELHEQLRRERQRASRAEAHLRDCQRMLSQVAERLRDADGLGERLGLTPDDIEQMAESRVPEMCRFKMSHYGCCKLGTYGCVERHEGEQSQIYGRLTLPAKVEE